MAVQDQDPDGSRAGSGAGEGPRAADERHRLALEAAGHAYFELDARSGRIVAGLPWTVAGYAPEDLTPALDAWMPLVHPDDRAALLDGMETQRTGRCDVHRIEYRIRAKAGGWRSLLVVTRVLSRDLDGVPMRIVGTMTDVTEARALRERLLVADRLASLGALAAGVAHAVNNPLATVASSVRALDEELERLQAEPQAIAGRLGDLRQEAADAAEGAERVRAVVRALQLFAAPRPAGASEPVDVRAELQTALELTRNAVTQRARLSAEVPASLPRVLAVPGELGQAFLHLLLEAAGAIPEGRAAENEVRVAAHSAGAHVVVEVRDSGPEIPHDDLARVFEPFFAARPHGAGAGLGLSVCHGVVAAAGGTIEVESAPGRRTTFRVTLPIAGTTKAHAAAATGDTSPRGRVLVLDDDPLVGRSLSRLLQRAHEVTVLTSARDAVERVAQGERWDAILCDLMMPELSGMDFEERLVSIAPDLVARIVYLTGGAFTDRARQFLAEGRPYLEKPVEAAVLRARVADLIRRA